VNTLFATLTSGNAMLMLGIASGVLSTIAFIPYIVDTIARRTHPQRASWLIWSVLGSIALVSQIYEGATASLWFAGVQVSGTIIVFLLSIRRGSGRFLSNNDYAILLAASVGLVLWYFTENAAYALAITISISLLGGLATAVKAFHDPDSETLSTWVISFIASACAMLAVGKMDFVLLAYPVYLFTLYLAFIVAILLGRARRSEALNTPVLRNIVRPARAALRTTADGIIVIVALVYISNNGLTLPSNTRSNSLDLSSYTGDTAIAQPPEATGDIATAFGTPESSPKHRDARSFALISTAAAAEISQPSLDIYFQSANQAYLTLDREDPFTTLVVDSATATLFGEPEFPQQQGTLYYGTTLTARAANGNWFKVSAPDGRQGLIHRSQVSVVMPGSAWQS
jgi:hypothetical protein